MIKNCFVKTLYTFAFTKTSTNDWVDDKIDNNFHFFVGKIHFSCLQSYKQFALVICKSTVIIWGIFKSGTTLES